MKRISLYVVKRKRFYFIGVFIIIIAAITIGIIPIIIITAVLPATLITTTTRATSLPSRVELYPGASNISVRAVNIGNFSLADSARILGENKFSCINKDYSYDDFINQTTNFLTSVDLYGAFLNTIILNFKCLSANDIQVTLSFYANSSLYIIPKENLFPIVYNYTSNAKFFTPPPGLSNFETNGNFTVIGDAIYQFPNGTLLNEDICYEKALPVDGVNSCVSTTTTVTSTQSSTKMSTLYESTTATVETTSAFS